MTTIHDIEAGERIDLTTQVVGFGRVDQRARIVEQEAGRPPRRIDGFSMGVSATSAPAPHGGEVHPDGDELLYLLSGAIEVVLELVGGDHEVELGPGDAVVVPQGVWHRISVVQPGHLLHLTPGPGGEARPRRTGPATREAHGGERKGSRP